MNIESVNSLKDFKEYETNLDISHKGLHIQRALLSDNGLIVVNSSTIYQRYYELILDITKPYTLTDEEYLKYRLRPKLLCYELYGITELWSLLLKVNNMVSITEFNRKNIRIMDSSKIFDVLNEILLKEESRIITNREYIQSLEEE